MLGNEPAEAEGTPFDPTTFTWPEELEATDEHKTALASLAKDHKITSEGMTAFVQLHSRVLKEMADRQTLAWNTQLDGWATEVRTKYGDKLTETIRACEGILQEFGSKALKDEIKATGLANHPAFFEFLMKVKKAVGEPGPVQASGRPEQATGLASMYPSMAKMEKH